MYLPGRAVRRDQTGNADSVHQSGQNETQGGSIGTAGNAESVQQVMRAGRLSIRTAELGPAGYAGG